MKKFTSTRMALKTFLVTKKLKQSIISATSLSLPDELKSGFIFGFVSVEDPNNTYCIGCANQNDVIPCGTTVVGLYHLDNSISDEDIQSICTKTIVKKSGKIIVLKPLNDNSDVSAKYIDLKKKNFSDCNIDFINDEDLYRELLTIHVVTTLTLDVKIESELSDTQLNLKTESAKLSEDIKLKSFSLKYSNFKLIKEPEENLLAIDLYNLIEDEEIREINEINAPENLKKKMKAKILKRKIIEKNPIEFELIETEDATDVTTWDSSSYRIKFNLKLDVAFLAQEKTNLNTLHRSIINGLCSQLQCMSNILIDQLNVGNFSIQNPKSFNFWPKSVCNYIISIIYPGDKTDDDLLLLRKDLHHKLLLPLDRPYIRKSNLSLFENNNGTYLRNPHIGLVSGLNGGKTSLIYGTYDYYHYNQNKMDDSGWGCAYRSLQTIVSWFKNQGYIDEDVPSHKEIQETLVQIGDKEASFIGSRKWIGSQEVSYVLDQLYKVTSKIMLCSSGSELPLKSRELAHHFDTQGTPVMIGGGVLAHTIIGIDFNEDNGDARFLVLDPHYTGPEDLITIQKKGFCGWKQPKFWDSNSFYNLCLPQRPLSF